MKSIQNQYRDLREGKMSQQNFMRNLRMTMPQYITNVTSFRDAIKILTNKRILSESYGYSEKDYDTLLNTILKHVKDPKEAEMYASNPTSMPGWLKANLEQDSKKQDMPGFEGTLDALNNLEEENLNKGGDYNAIIPALKAKGITYGMPESEIINAIAEVMEELGYTNNQILNLINRDEDFIPDLLQDLKNSGGEEDDAAFDAMIKAAEDEKTGEEAVNAQYDIYEAKKPKKKEEKIEYSEHSCSPTELRLGIKTELENENVSELDKAKEIALKNIHKDPVYYTKLKLSGLNAQPKVKDIKAEPAKKAKKETPQLVDLVNGMQKVKMPKADDKKKLKENVEEEGMYFKDLPADPEKYKTVKDSKGKIIKATNAEGNEFQRGDETTAVDNGEKVKIADFKEEQGKIKALYSKGMFFSTIDIDGLNPVKETMRPGVDMGGSFEKMKRSLEEMVREVIAESPYGYNLIDPLAAEEENK